MEAVGTCYISPLFHPRPAAMDSIQPSRRRQRIPQAERVENTQRKLIDAALQLLHEEGFKGATLQAIARRAQVSLGALQHHFKTRDALMERLVQEVMAPLSSQGSAWPDYSLPLPERAQDFVQRAWRNIFGTPHYQAAWSLFLGCKSSPALFTHINQQRLQVDSEFYVQFLRIFPEIERHHPSPQGVAAAVFAALRGAGVLEFFDVTATERNVCLHTLADTIVQAGRPVTHP